MNFQKLFIPSSLSAKDTVEIIVKILKIIAIYWYSFLEDLEGARNRPDLRYCVTVMLIETLVQTEMLMEPNQNQDLEEEHYLAVALENGLTNVINCTGSDIIRDFHLDSLDGDSSEIVALCKNMIRGLSEYIPDPMKSSNSLEFIKSMADWVRAMRQAGVSHNLIEF